MNRNERDDLERALAAEDRFWERQSLLRQLWKADQALSDCRESGADESRASGTAKS